MSSAQFFSHTYAEARARFLTALEGAGGRSLTAYSHPLKGPLGEALWTDVGRLGPENARKLLVLVSGTHGIEGFCGSGCHTGWLAGGGHARDLPDDVAVIFVHAVNPHGFAWQRRVNEDNVDLNRNFLDHAKPYPVNADYVALQRHINPEEWSADIVARSEAAIRAHYGNPVGDFLAKAIHGGQYVNPKGTFFGGNAPTWSNRTFREIVATFLRNAEQICLIDYHTGGGVFGFCDLFVDDRKAGARSRDWFEHCTPIEAVRVEHGHAQSDVPGLLMYVAQDTLTDSRVTSCLVEMRTRSKPSLLRPMCEENWLFQHGDPDSEQGRAVRAEVRELFYPSAPEWKPMVLRQSNAMIREALTGLGSA
ncbi:MAG: DUF2817 domain-containing protein [Alphaproteobacteria bacterium]|nr:DUF2817 domain-containing protein [Alphaproteobacteria bacterium]